jgi:hypothetical protein
VKESKVNGEIAWEWLGTTVIQLEEEKQEEGTFMFDSIK